MGKLLLVGCGKMGGAMLDGWLARGFAAADAVVAEPVEALRPNKPGLRTVASTSEVRERPEVVVLAVKPQSMDAVLPDLKRFADEGSVGSWDYMSLSFDPSRVSNQHVMDLITTDGGVLLSSRPVSLPTATTTPGG